MSQFDAPWGLTKNRKENEKDLYVNLLFNFIDKSRLKQLGNNQWIFSENSCISFYVRFFNPNGYPRPRLEIANVMIAPQGKGIFTYILSKLEQNGQNVGYDIFIENVMANRFQTFFIKRGYVGVKYRPLCYILYTENANLNNKEEITIPNVLGN